MDVDGVRHSAGAGEIIVYVISLIVGGYAAYQKWKRRKEQAEKQVADKQVGDTKAAAVDVYDKVQIIMELTKEREIEWEKRWIAKCLEHSSELARANLAEKKLAEAEQLIISLQKKDAS